MAFAWLARLLGKDARPALRRLQRTWLKPIPPKLEQLEDRIQPAGLAVTDLTQGLTPTDLVNTIVGSGITVSNITFNGAQGAAGKFTGGTGIIGFEGGIILSTGKASSVIGPNSSDSTSKDWGLPGDPQLDVIAGSNTNDACDLEFDFVPTTSTLTFNYVFGSEEYNEFVGSSFNDAFAFFVNGKNVALTPGTNLPVTINTINKKINSKLYRDNDRNDFPNNQTPINTELDGLTVVLPVTASVQAGVKNHIKLVIADASDGIYDSDVFLEAGSFSGGKPSSPGSQLVTAPDIGGLPIVNVYDPLTGKLKMNILAYDPSFLGGVRVATGDVNGDGVPDIITAPGPSGGPDIRIFDGTSGDMIGEFMAYDPNWRGGVYVAAADVNGDGKADIITGPDFGGGPEVKVFNGTNLKVISDFMAYDPHFFGGVRVAGGDLNGDGKADVITGAGPGSLPMVRAFSAGDPNVVLQTFDAYSGLFRGGVYVGAGNFGNVTPTGGGHQDIITGAGAGGGPHVEVWDGLTGQLRKSFMADALGTLFYDDGAAFQAGVRVAGVDVTGDGFAEIIVSFGPPHSAVVKSFDYQTTVQVDSFDAYAGFTGGVFVGGG